ncbi:MAG: hypothetical protein WKF83_12430 [Nocardioidaceae bacterium]
MHGVQADAVVAPAVPSGNAGDRHQLDDVDAELDEVVEPLDRRRRRCPSRGERADVQLVQHRTRTACTPRQLVVGPGERRQVDDLATGPSGPSGSRSARGSGMRVAAVEREARSGVPGASVVLAHPPVAGARGPSAASRRCVTRSTDRSGSRRPHLEAGHRASCRRSCRPAVPTGSWLEQVGDRRHAAVDLQRR